MTGTSSTLAVLRFRGSLVKDTDKYGIKFLAMKNKYLFQTVYKIYLKGQSHTFTVLK